MFFLFHTWSQLLGGRVRNEVQVVRLQSRLLKALGHCFPQRAPPNPHLGCGAISHPGHGRGILVSQNLLLPLSYPTVWSEICTNPWGFVHTASARVQMNSLQCHLLLPGLFCTRLWASKPSLPVSYLRRNCNPPCLAPSGATETHGILYIWVTMFALCSSSREPAHS